MKDSDHWSDVAAEWNAWARTPNHDSFWAYREALLAFVGPGPGDALDVGCGEGRERMRRWTRQPLFLWLEARPFA